LTPSPLTQNSKHSLRGVTYQKQDVSTTERDGFLPILRAGNITDCGLTFDDLIYVPSSKISLKQMVRKNDVVIAASSGSIEVVGKAAPALADFKGGFGAFCKVLRPYKEVDPVYFSHFFKTPDYRRRISFLAAGANINNLRNEDLDGLQIPLPPLAEQQRIAAILDAADTLRAKRREAIAQLDSFLQSTFIDMFGDPVRNEKGWEICKVSDYVSAFQGGKNVDPEDLKIVTKNRVVKVSSVTSMIFRPEESKPLPDSYEPPKEHFIKPGDLLFSRANTSELVGAVAYVKSTPQNITLADKVWRFVWKNPLKVEPLFVWMLFQSPAVRLEISRRATGTSGSMKNISQSKTLSIQTIHPPLPLQHRFATIVESVEQQKARMQAHLAELDALFASLQARAFNGEL
jgi:type I restriction enzyme, S subunit